MAAAACVVNSYFQAEGATNDRMHCPPLLAEPLMILAAPSLGGVIGQLTGWRALFWLLAGWGALTMLFFYCFVVSQ